MCEQMGCVGECRANLSELYFTHRQDRYVMLSSCPPLADFFDRLVSCVQRYSFQLLADDSVRLADGVTCHPFAGMVSTSYSREGKGGYGSCRLRIERVGVQVSEIP